MKPEELVQAMAQDRRAATLWNLASRIVWQVFKARVGELVDGVWNSPEIDEPCRRFRRLAYELGYQVPESNEDLYREVIRPLHLTFVREGR